MKGSNVNNIRLDPAKQKIVECDACGAALVVGKFAKKNQTCFTANQFPTNSKCSPHAGKKNSAREKMAIVEKSNGIVRKVEPKAKTKPKPKIEAESKKENVSFGKNYIKLMNQLGFDIDKQRRFKKKYAIAGGGVVFVYPNVDQSVGSGGKPELEWFNVIEQRAVGINEDFRKFMPPDAASDCELIASEIGNRVISRPDIGTVRCDECGSMTDEFGIGPDKNKVLCVKPNDCFRKAFTNGGAEAQE